MQFHFSVDNPDRRLHATEVSYIRATNPLQGEQIMYGDCVPSNTGNVFWVGPRCTKEKKEKLSFGFSVNTFFGRAEGAKNRGWLRPMET